MCSCLHVCACVSVCGQVSGSGIFYCFLPYLLRQSLFLCSAFPSLLEWLARLWLSTRLHPSPRGNTKITDVYKRTALNAGIELRSSNLYDSHFTPRVIPPTPDSPLLSCKPPASTTQERRLYGNEIRYFNLPIVNSQSRIPHQSSCTPSGLSI